MPKVLTIGVAAALAAAAVLSGGTAQAATPTARDHVVPLTGSDQYVIYEVAKATKDVQPGNRNRGKLFARDKQGHVSALPNFTDGTGGITQVGHVLVENSFVNVTSGGVTNGVERVRERDLRTGAESVVTLGAQETLATVAPDGYVVRHDLGGGDGASDAGETTLTYRHLDGTTADLPVPFADHTAYVLEGGDQVLLAVTPSSDEETRPARISFMRWSQPGVWHALWNAGTQRDVFCSKPSSTHVACDIANDDWPGLGLVLFRLSDGHATWMRKTHPKACTAVDITTKGTNLYALETSDAGVCTKGKLYRLQDDGTLVGGSKKYLFNALAGITTAYNRVVLSGGDQRHLYATTGVTQKPRIIVTP